MITLCVPTFNRPEFLARLLHYYAATRFRHQISIGDSSDPERARRNREVIASLQGTLNLTYAEYPGCSSLECLEQISRAIKSPYCAYTADDDVLCTDGIERCIEFLESSRDYGAAHGQALLVQLEERGPYGTLGRVGGYPMSVIDASTGARRLHEFFTSSLYTVLYSVHRTATWRAMFQGISAMQGTQNTNVLKDELLAVCVSVIRGRIKEIEGLYLVRHAHDEILKHPSIYAWLTRPEWSPSFQIFQARLIEELVEQDGISEEAARDVIRDVFWPYLISSLTHAWRRHQSLRIPKSPSRIRHTLKAVPGARAAWRSARAAVQRWRDELSLPALMRPASAYHADFMPVYRAFTTPPLAPAGGETTPVDRRSSFVDRKFEAAFEQRTTNDERPTTNDG